MIHVVVARYNEELEWLKKIDLPSNSQVIVYNKGSDYNFAPEWDIVNLPNLGQCWGSFFTYLTQYSGKYPACTIFLTGCCMSSLIKQRATLNVLNDVLGGKEYSFPCLEHVISLRGIANFKLDAWTSQTKENEGGVYSKSLIRPLKSWFIHYFPNKKLSHWISYFSIFALSNEQMQSYSECHYQKLNMILGRSSLQEEAHYLERLIPSIWEFNKEEKLKKLWVQYYYVILSLAVCLIVYLIYRFRLSY
jgi:hypothetical protein